MTDIISDMAAKAGISTDMARKGMGAVLEMCKSKLPAEAYSKLSAAVPGAEGLVAASVQQSAQEQPAGPGVFGSVTGMLGKMFGAGGGGTELASKLAGSGFSMDQIQAFLPQVMGFLKDKIPTEYLQKFSGMVPSGMLDAGQTPPAPPPQ